MFPPRRILVVIGLTLWLIVIAACSDSDSADGGADDPAVADDNDEAAVEETSDGGASSSSGAAEDGAESDSESQSDGADDGDADADSNGDDDENDDAEDDGSAPSGDTNPIDESGKYIGADSPQGWRPAPVSQAKDPIELTFWNDYGWMTPTHAGWSPDSLPSAVDPNSERGLLRQVVNTGTGIVYQRQDGEQTIWRDVVGGADEILVSAKDDQYLRLVGGRVPELDGESYMYYSLRTGSTPETTEEALYSYDLRSGEQTKLVVTGGWESGTTFFIHDDSYPQVVGLWTGEAYAGNMVVDLEASEVVFNPDDQGLICFDGEPNCPAYMAAAFSDGVVYGVRTVFDEATQTVDTIGVFRLDLDSAQEEQIAAFAWDNDLWYPRHMMIRGGQVIISTSDGDGAALAALVVDVASGEAHTLQQAGFVGPGYLS